MKRWRDDITAQIDDAAAFRNALGIMPKPLRPTTANHYVLLSCRPDGVNLTALSTVKDIWRFAPFIIDEDWTIDQIAVNTTGAASGGTASMIFGLFSLADDGRPDARVADWSAAAIDLTAAPGPLTASLATTIPKGRWAVGFGWTGTASTAPTMSVVSTNSSGVGSTPLSTTASGWSYVVSGGSVPASVTPAASALTAPAIWIRN